MLSFVSFFLLILMGTSLAHAQFPDAVPWLNTPFRIGIVLLVVIPGILFVTIILVTKVIVSLIKLIKRKS